MTPLSASLNAEDRKHLRRILNESIALDKDEVLKHSRVAEFLRDAVGIAEDALDSFRALDQAKRERILSDLVWRITCHLDGSVTSVQGKKKYSLGGGFAVRPEETEGKTAFCVVKKR